MMYKKIIIAILCTSSLINVIAKETGISKIEKILSAYEETKEAIGMLGDVNHRKEIDIHKTEEQVGKFRNIKIDNKDNDIRKMKKALDNIIWIVYILKCESLINPKFLNGEVGYPQINYPASIKYLKHTSVVDHEYLKKTPKALEDYNRALEDYKNRKKIYSWNHKLKKMSSLHKKLFFSPLASARRESILPIIPLIIAYIHDKDKQKEWLAQILKTIKYNKKTKTK